MSAKLLFIRKGVTLSAFAISLLSGAVYAQDAHPVIVTSGFNQDIIANGVGNASASTTVGFDQHNTRALVSQDFRATSSSNIPVYGLPASGEIHSLATSGVHFQLANYTGNNALFLTPGYVNNGAPSTGTLSFNVSNINKFYLLAGVTGGGNQTQQATVTVNFSDNTTQTGTITINDWYNGEGYAIQGIGRINITNNNLEGDATNPRLYEVGLTLDEANYYKTVTGITFSFEGSQSAEWASEVRLSVLAVSAVASPEQQASVTVTVQNDAPATITTDNGTLQLAAAVTPATGTVTWNITEGATLASISAAGLVTALDNGVVTVRAALNSDATVFDDVEITITNQLVAATSVTVSVEDDAPAVITENAGTLQLIATVAPDNAESTDVTWAITEGSEFAEVSESGLVTAIANGTITVTATTASGEITDTIEIVISGQTIAVTSVTVTVENDAEPTITTTSGTLQLLATVLPDDATNMDVDWTLQSGEGIVTVNDTGLVTAIANGTAVVRATAGEVFGEITVIVNVPTSGTESFEKAAMFVYPSVTERLVNISSQQTVIAVYIYDSLGREILRSAQTTINLESFNSGIYLLKIELDGGFTQTTKVVKK